MSKPVTLKLIARAAHTSVSTVSFAAALSDTHFGLEFHFTLSFRRMRLRVNRSNHSRSAPILKGDECESEGQHPGTESPQFFLSANGAVFAAMPPFQGYKDKRYCPRALPWAILFLRFGECANASVAAQALSRA